MKLFGLFVALALFANVPTCLGGMIFTVTPTARFDDFSTVRITYTVTGAADLGTQDVGFYFVRLVYNNIGPNGTPSNISNIFSAPAGTPFGINPGGPWDTVTVTPITTNTRWVGQNASLSNSGVNVTITTAGAFIGRIDLTWDRPSFAGPSYDAAIPLANIIAAYRVGPYTAAGRFHCWTSSVRIWRVDIDNRSA